MKKPILLTVLYLVSQVVLAQNISYTNDLENSNHPQIGYWFLIPSILENGQYLADLEEMIDNTSFDFYFLDARHGANFQNADTMHEVVSNIVDYAHSRGVKIGLRARFWEQETDDDDKVRFIGDSEIKLNSKGKGSCHISTKFIRHPHQITAKRVFRVYVFKQSEKGFYEPESLCEIDRFTYQEEEDGIAVEIDAGPEYKGYTAFVMADFYMPSPCNHSLEAQKQLSEFVSYYADIPLDGVMLDEHHNWSIIPPWSIRFKTGKFRNRYYSEAMAAKLEDRSGEPAPLSMFHMRYAPEGKPHVRMKAINQYMDLLRQGPMQIELLTDRLSKKAWGGECFMACHNTFHNETDKDDIWTTGLTWWTVPRHYGQTDEHVKLPVQMGVAMAYKANAMYNMYYDNFIARFEHKALSDLRYGVRTHYHAFNDIRWWRVDLSEPKFYQRLDKVLEAERLLNRFDPPLPETKLLVIFGVEALQNWYPEYHHRNRHDFNRDVRAEQRANLLHRAGYMNALVPSDLINNGTLTLNSENTPEMNGHVFDAVVYLNPQYSKERTISFLTQYSEKGGMLMIEGEMTHSFNGDNVSEEFQAIRNRATIKSFSANEVSNLGIKKNTLKDGCLLKDGSLVYTHTRSLRNSKQKTINIDLHGNEYSISFSGFVAIKADSKGLLKLSGMGISQIEMNSQTIFELSEASNLFIERVNSEYIIEIYSRHLHFIVSIQHDS